jgi:hypothetical protein
MKNGQRQHARRLAEGDLVTGQAGGQLWSIRWIAVQQHVTTDQPTVDLVQQHFAAELYCDVCLALADDGRVRLEKADQLVRGRHALSEQDPPLGLLDDLLQERSNVGERRAETVGSHFGLSRQVLLRPFRLA